jgi:hypothetical protein
MITPVCWRASPYAAQTLEETPHHWASPGRRREGLVAENEQRLRDAQHELERAWITGPHLPGGDDILEPLELLVGALPRARDESGRRVELTDPREVREMAEEALRQMYAIEYDRMPPWSERLMGMVYGLLHPVERRRTRERLANPQGRELATRLLDHDQDRGE